MHSRAVYWDSMDEALECQPTMWSVPDKTWLGSNLGDLWASRKALGEALIGTKTMSWHTPVATNLQFGRESSLKQCSGPLSITCQSCRSAVFHKIVVNILNWTLTTASPTRKRLPHFRQNDKGSSGFEKCQSTRTGSGEVSLDVRATQGAMWYAFRLQDEANTVIMIRTSSVRINENYGELMRIACLLMFNETKPAGDVSLRGCQVAQCAPCRVTNHVVGATWMWLNWIDMSACITFD